MPANVVPFANAKGAMTNAAKRKRREAESSQSRKKVTLVKPRLVKDDPEASRIWDRIVYNLKGVSLLDNLDIEMLGVYCQAMSVRNDLSEAYSRGMIAVRRCEEPAERLVLFSSLDDVLKRLQAQERLILPYAEKLGLTPTGRIRLAVNKAKKPEGDPNGDLYGDGGE